MSKSDATLAFISKSEKYAMSATHPWLPEQARPAPNRGGWKTTYLTRHKTAGIIVGERGSQATALLTNLDNEIKELEDTIAKDERSLKEMDNNLRIENLAAKRLQNKIWEEQKMINAMNPDQGLGAAIKQFDNSMVDTKVVYKHLRERHGDAINILKKEFAYNPGFKKGQRGDREFQAAYHTMSKDPSKIQRPSNR